jgi:hypothetical protein
MITFSEFTPEKLKKLSSTYMKDIIIQKGPRLFNIDSINQQELTICIKKLSLEKRPKSVHNSSVSNRIQRNYCYAKPVYRFDFQKKRESNQTYLVQPYNSQQNPFQNERLKSSTSKRLSRNSRRAVYSP